jgi:hypothetical protein
MDRPLQFCRSQPSTRRKKTVARSKNERLLRKQRPEAGGNAATSKSNRNLLLLLVLQIAQTFSPCTKIASIRYQLYKNLTIPFKMGYVGEYKGLVLNLHPGLAP